MDFPLLRDLQWWTSHAGQRAVQEFSGGSELSGLGGGVLGSLLGRSGSFQMGIKGQAGRGGKNIPGDENGVSRGIWVRGRGWGNWGEFWVSGTVLSTCKQEGKGMRPAWVRGQ